MTESDKIAVFWAWFIRNEVKLRSGQSRSEVVGEIFEQIALIDDGIGCEVGGVKNDPPELIIVAYGDQILFPLVDRVVAAAPKVGKWLFHALAPARGFEFKCSWNGIWIDYKEIKFDPLTSKSNSDALGISLVLPDALFLKDGEAEDAAYRCVATALGERNAALKIQHIEAVPRGSEDHSKKLAFSELADYIVWHDKKFRRA